jgi:hypothetical protein
MRVPYPQRYHALTTLSFEKPTVMTVFSHPDLILKNLLYKIDLTGVRLGISARMIPRMRQSSSTAHQDRHKLSEGFAQLHEVKFSQRH